MIGANLAILLLLGQAPTSSPSDLVDQLGSPRYVEREKATEALARLGIRALPALREAHDAKDPEVRSRAAALVDKIEALALTEPTLVALNLQDRPLPEAVKAIGDQAGIKLALIPENSPAWRMKRVTLQESSPLPFWKALDRLCEAGHLQYNLGTHASPTSREPIFPLFAGGDRPSGPISDVGPFRIQLLSLHYQRDVTFAPRPRPSQTPERGSRHTISEQFFVQVQVAAEPRLSVSQNGPIRIDEAVDDRGQSLVVPSGASSAQRHAGYFGMSMGTVVQLQAHLRRPEQPGKSIQKLRGVVPIAVATRKPNPLVVPLAGASGKSFRNEQVTLAIQEIRTNPNSNQTSIELAVRHQGGQGASTNGPGAQGNEFMLHRQDVHQQQIEVLDARGRTIPWYHSSFDAEGARITLTLTPPDGVATPTELRYYSLARTATEVPFEFADVAMP